ncbi:hypothetical protein PHLCEN_2v10870 [Hermanssonia centrifuga]|uniref:F-box domain-containing protein n=1 Tax=Hermanssonia centrifuga TaxID=98765 RepID=A0A2R6NMK1_9APHY|nr:hypothetical protein PHLCEN_2v10870 [Hermanssonia centrifuga]
MFDFLHKISHPRLSKFGLVTKWRANRRHQVSATHLSTDISAQMTLLPPPLLEDTAGILPVGFREASPTLEIVDILYEILHALRKTDLFHCAQVNRFWRTVAQDVAWRSSSSGGVGVRQLLSVLDEYSEKYSTSRFSVTLMPRSWNVLRRDYAPLICSLTLDLAHLPCSRWFLETISDTLTSPVHLPNLGKLHIILEQDPVQLSVVKQFFACTVRDLTVEVLSTNVTRRPLHVHTAGLIPVFWDPTISPDNNRSTEATLVLMSLFDAIREWMVGITALQINVRGSHDMVLSWHPFVQMLLSLASLRSISLPGYALSRLLLAILSSHAQLRRVAIVKPRVDQRIAIELEDASDALFTIPVYDLDGPSSSLEELALTVPIPEFTPYFTIHFDPYTLTTLHLLFPGEVSERNSVKHAFLLIANQCPHLVDLRLLVLQTEEHPWRIDYELLQPFCRYGRLVSLDITSRFTTDLKEDQFIRLVSSWPMLRHLSLEGCDAMPFNPAEEAALSLGTALDVLAEHFQTNSAHHAAHRPRYTSLEAGTLLIGFPITNTAAEIATHLQHSLPKFSKLTYQPVIRQTVSEGNRPLSWGIRRETLTKFAHDIASNNVKQK